MAGDFTFKQSWTAAISELPDADQPEVYRAVVLFATVGEEPILPSLSAFVFNFIRKEIKADEAKRVALSKARSEAGKKGSDKRWGKHGKKWQTIATDSKNSNCHICHKEEPQPTETQEETTETAETPEIQENKESTPHTPLKGIKENLELNEEKKIKKKKTRKVFVKPTIEEVRAYIAEKEYTIDAEQFWNFYESKGWMVGRNHMVSWHAAIATWKKGNNYGNTQNSLSPDEQQRQASIRALQRIRARGDTGIDDALW